MMRLVGLVQAANDPLSRRHCNVTPVPPESVPVNENVATVVLVTADGVLVIETAGATVSTIQEKLVVELFEAESVPVT
jgi:hypothetical protein